MSANMDTRRILIVDDTPAIHSDYSRILAPAVVNELSDLESQVFGEPQAAQQVTTHWELDHAFQGAEALELLKRITASGDAYDLAFVDMRMPPGWDGLQTIEKLWKVQPQLQVVICTAWSDYSWQEIDARLGRSDQLLILKKPFDAAEVAQMASTLSEKHRLQQIQLDYTRELEKQVRVRTAEVVRAHEETIHMLVRASIHRDSETGNHIKRVGLYSARLAMAMGMDQAEADLIRLAAPMHDVGKIGIPDRVLQKPGSLTPEEREIMETHTTIGADMLAGSESPVLRMACEIALCHHERWDGAGYPRGLKREEIPLSARIVAVADVYDALTQPRVYRPAMPEHQVLALLLQGRGTHFDPELIDLLIELKKDFQLIAATHADNVAKDTASDELLSMLGPSAEGEISSATEPRRNSARQMPSPVDQE